ncbi:hypothetical protein [Streptomyces acidicola]|uniref:hypothetical protein n=1 Tax=Streptomyces acidicola TaxID=2596892 RepID=UPI00381C5606
MPVPPLRGHGEPVTITLDDRSHPGTDGDDDTDSGATPLSTGSPEADDGTPPPHAAE